MSNKQMKETFTEQSTQNPSESRGKQINREKQNNDKPKTEQNGK